jgi:hypothetical protein
MQWLIARLGAIQPFMMEEYPSKIQWRNGPITVHRG